MPREHAARRKSKHIIRESCREDVYFADVNGSTKPLDTGKVTDYLDCARSLSFSSYLTYTARDSDFARAGLDNPQYCVTFTYEEDGEEKTAR